MYLYIHVYINNCVCVVCVYVHVMAEIKYEIMTISNAGGDASHMFPLRHLWIQSGTVTLENFLFSCKTKPAITIQPSQCTHRHLSQKNKNFC